jgi:tetratricopeptide (TPR) repeat protein
MRPIAACGAPWITCFLLVAQVCAADVEDLIAQGNYSAALPVLEAAREAAARAGRHDHEVAVVLNNLGSIYDELGRHRDAQSMYERSLAEREALGESATAETARTINNLGAVFYKLHMLSRAEETLGRAAALDAGFHDDLQLAKVWINLGMVYQAERRWDDAEHMFRAALEIRERELGPGHPDVAVALNDLGVLFQKQSRLEEAGPVLERALRTWQTSIGATHPWVAAALNNLGVLYTSLGRVGDAEKSFQQAIRIAQTVLPAGHPHLASYMASYAHLLRKIGRTGEAKRLEAYARESRERYEAQNLLGRTVDVHDLRQ